jgi:hypothetical protein
MRRLFLLGLLTCLPLCAGPLLTVNGGFTVGSFLEAQALASSWTFGSTFTNVAINAVLRTDTTPENVTAFLLTGIGAGTTIAQQLATTIVAAPSAGSGPTLVSVFSGLTLGPGTYFLVLNANTSGVGDTLWMESLNGATITAAPGVTHNIDNSVTATLNAYVPASNFHTITANLDYTITGDTTSTPEPTTLLAVASGLIILGLVRRRHT